VCAVSRGTGPPSPQDRAPQWVEIAVTVTPRRRRGRERIEVALDYLCGELFSLGAAGLWTDERKASWEDDPGSGRRAAYVVRAYFPGSTREDLSGRVDGAVQAVSDVLSVEVARGEVADRDWARVARRGLVPVRVGAAFTIAPAWEAHRPERRRRLIRIDPGAAFGTGHHPTTACCLRGLEAEVRPGSAVLDLGTGTGVLAIAAARLGAQSVLAVDRDEAAVHAAVDNVRLNDVEDVVEVRLSDARDVLRSHPRGGAPPFDVIVANMSTAVLCQIAPHVPAATSPSGAGILSGISAERREQVVKRACGCGLRFDHYVLEGGWATVVVRLP